MADAPILDECIHLMTTAFCTICKEDTKAKEARARRKRAGNAGTWEVYDRLPFPHTIATRDGLCPECDEDVIHVGDEIHLVDGSWVCRPCAVDAQILAGGTG